MKEHCNNKANFFFLYMRPVGKGTHSDFSSTSSLQNGSTGLLDRRDAVQGKEHAGGKIGHRSSSCRGSLASQSQAVTDASDMLS